MNRITELKEAIDKQRVYDVLVYGAFIALSEAWKRDPDVSKVSWKKLDSWPVVKANGFDSIQQHQHAVDEMRSQMVLLTVGDETCCVKKDVIEELRLILGR